jgi:sugar lactone lactonase YvrE
VSELKALLDGFTLGESPRWHDGRLWFCDWGRQQVVAVALDGTRDVIASLPSSPFCIDWLPDGRLLVVSARDGRLLRQEPDGSLVTHAELTALSGQPWNDIAVDGRGNAYVGNIGFDFPGGQFAPGSIAVVAPDGSARQAADGLAFPNGMAVTPDNSTLILAESYAASSPRSISTLTEACQTAGSGPTWAMASPPTASAWTPTAPSGTPTSRTSTACASAQAARRCRRSSWTAAATPARSAGQTTAHCS